MSCCGLTEYGRRELCIATILFVAAAGILAWLGWSVSWWFWAAGVVPVVLWLWVLWFFRDPERVGPADAGALISPADGTVSDITPIGADSELGRDGVRIGVFMSIFSVHVNRSPADGRIDSLEHRPGAFLDVRDPMASERNESMTIRMTRRGETGEHPIVVRQIAGLVARRIVTDLSEGQTVARGQRIGMIKFGSRLELLVPRELVGEIAVQVGDPARAGETVLVRAAGGEAQ